MSMHGPALRNALDGEYHQIKQHFRTALTPDIVVRPHDQTMAEARQWALDSLYKLSEIGYSKVGIPEGFGDDQPLSYSIAAFEVLAMGDLSLTVKSGVQQGLFGGAIMNLGNDEQKQKWMPGVLNMEVPGCYGMTELGRGSDVQSLETTITYIPDADEFEIHTPNEDARKAYIGNAAEHGQLAAIFGKLMVGGEDHGVHCIIVPIRDESGNALAGVTLGDHGLKGGLLGVDNGTIAFDHVRVPRGNLLNRYGTVDDDGNYHSPIEHPGKRFYTTLSTLVRGRISVGGAASSAARRGLTIAARHALSRTQFSKTTGEPVTIMEYQAHQKKLMPALAQAYAFGFAQNRLTRHFQEVRDGADEKTTRELESRAAGLKAVQTRWANDTLQMCREACGGYGYMSENGLTTLRGDADVFATFEGDNTVLFQLVGRALLAEFQSSWKDLDMLEAARRSASLVGNRLIERTTAPSTIDRLITLAQRKKGDEVLLARGWQVEMLEFREKRIVEALGMRMRDVLKLPKEEQFEGFNACQNHLIAAAKAHMDRIVLEAFIDGISETPEGPARDLLIKLCDLYALTTIRGHRAWFLERGQFDGARSRTLTAIVERLSKELTDNVEDIVEGLGVPEEWLNSKIAERP
ncbi:acyl-CoA dehydrogenase [Corynebacterium breve]|uniref:Acyl-CoA dehydrogenase n=1 Tax=Corynebacterium breve TaxID=3049799 RepID=A0ABY8VHB7_9CORY|nr:acyl-CoA dehydrogenase [Corynebacterium breve]WIM67653.1 acyl-CoA dehydrogenase [Corynebacterium breve]